MKKSIFTTAAAAIALAATPALATETSETQNEAVEVAVHASDFVGVASLLNGIAPALVSAVTAQCNGGCAADNVVIVSDNTEATPPVSFGGTVVSKYVFSDLFVQTDSPTAQVWASLDTSVIGIKGCSLDLFASHGFTTTVGREADVGASCRFDLAKDVNVELSASRYILGGATDITTLVAKVSHGPVDASVTQYIVDGAESDATKVELGLTVEPAKRLSLRGVLTYEHGFGLPDIYVGGVEANYAVTDHWALTFSGYVPIRRTAGDPRSSEVAVGVQFNF